MHTKRLDAVTSQVVNTHLTIVRMDPKFTGEPAIYWEIRFKGDPLQDPNQYRTFRQALLECKIIVEAAIWDHLNDNNYLEERQPQK